MCVLATSQPGHRSRQRPGDTPSKPPCRARGICWGCLFSGSSGNAGPFAYDQSEPHPPPAPGRERGEKRQKVSAKGPTMIAKNLLKYAEAMALQLPLPFRRLVMLRQSRPTTRAGRTARAARAAIRRLQLAIRVIYITKPVKTKKPTRSETPWAQLSLFITKHSLLATKKGQIWVQTEIAI